MQMQINDKLKLTDNTEEAKKSDYGYDYTKFKENKDFDWDEDLENKFSPIAKKLNLSQESIDTLLDIALEMTQKQKAAYEKDELTKQNENIVKFNKLFNEDSELPSVNSMQIKEYMTVANGAYSDFTSPELKELLTKTGYIYHPEFIKMFHKIGELSQEDTLSHYGKPNVDELTPAQILYGTK